MTMIVCDAASDRRRAMVMTKDMLEEVLRAYKRLVWPKYFIVADAYGHPEEHRCYNRFYVYDCVKNEAVEAVGMAQVVMSFAITGLGGRVLLSGGQIGECPISDCDVLCKQNLGPEWVRCVGEERWDQKFVGRMRLYRKNHAIVALTENIVFVCGGDFACAPDSAELFYVNTGKAVKTLNLMAAGRYDHRICLLANGKVLITGGRLRNYPRQGMSDTESCYLFDPATLMFSGTGSMLTPRSCHTLDLLPDGTALVTGGNSGIGDPLKLCEVYDPETGQWSVTGSLSTARSYHGCMMLPEGPMVVDIGHEPFPSCELYSLETRTWSPLKGVNLCITLNSFACCMI
jgi:hypothetical protein